MHPQIRLSFDSRLEPLVDLLNQAFRLARQNDSPLNLWRLLKQAEHFSELNSMELYRFLEFMGLVVRKKSEPVRFLKPKRSTAVEIRRKLREIQLLFWAVSSQWYPQGKIVQANKAKVLGILKDYNFPEEDYEGLMLSLKLSAYFERVRRAGGIRLIHPSKLPPAAFRPNRDSLIRISTSDGKKAAFSKKDTKTLRLAPVGRTFNKQSVQRESDLKKVALRLFSNHGFSERNLSEMEFYKQSIGSATKQKEYKNWRIIDEPTRKQSGDWRYPDILGYRIVPSPIRFFAELELLAVELKHINDTRRNKGKFLELEWVRQAESNLDFANIVYLLVDATFAEVRSCKRNLAHLAKTGVGLIVQEEPGNYYRWIEALPPSYRVQRSSSVARLLQEYLGNNYSEIEEQFARLQKEEGPSGAVLQKRTS